MLAFTPAPCGALRKEASANAVRSLGACCLMSVAAFWRVWGVDATTGIVDKRFAVDAAAAAGGWLSALRGL